MRASDSSDIKPLSKGDPLKKRDMQKFRKTLEEQRDEILSKARKTLSGEIHLDPDDFPDEIDSASSEMNLAFQGRLRERERGTRDRAAPGRGTERRERGSGRQAGTRPRPGMRDQAAPPPPAPPKSRKRAAGANRAGWCS